MVVFVGPQAVGKTTQAKLLKRELQANGYKQTHVAELVDYISFYSEFRNLLLKTLFKNRKYMVKFYGENPPFETIDPEIRKKIFIIVEAIHLAGFLISSLKEKMLRMRYSILIESEGFVFKLLADIWFEANWIKINKGSSLSQRLLKKMTEFWIIILLRSTPLVIIHMHTDYLFIRERCLKRKSSIEPSEYIAFQSYLYSKITSMLCNNSSRTNTVMNVNVDASPTINVVHRKIFSSVVHYLRC